MNQPMNSSVIRWIVIFSFLTLAAGCGGSGGGSNPDNDTHPAAPTITTQPADRTTPLNVEATFTVTASGESLTYLWERSDDNGTTWSTVAGANGPSLAFTPSDNTTRLFRCTVTNPSGSKTSDPATLTVIDDVITAPTITAQPADRTTPLNVAATFTVTATGESLTYLWEKSNDNGTTWGTVAGATGPSLAFTPSDKTTRLFRCTVTNPSGSATSDPATLTVIEVVYVNAAATGSNTGTRWADAYTTLQAGLAAAPAISEIWVAAGTYSPGPNAADTFTLKPTVAVYGGFIGDETRRDARDTTAGTTILTGNTVCAHVVTGANSAILDGFVITSGNSTDASGNDGGGGMINSGCSPTIRNCTFINNTARFGGGMANYGANPTLTRCTFQNNSAAVQGGGILNCNGSSPAITGCKISGNMSGMDGGGIYNLDACNPVFINCVITGNSAASGGGGLCNGYASNPALINCTMTGNAAASGGGMFNYGTSNPVVYNCILWNDSSEFFSISGSGQEITNSCVTGGSTVNGNIADDPKLIGDMTLQSGSPCINTGNDALLPSGITADFMGRARIIGPAVDMGACEYNP
jgi:hypothetical protein